MSILDTTGGIFPEGSYRFRITDVPEKVIVSGYVAYQFSFEAEVNGIITPYSERFMIWLMSPICKALGFPEIAPGKFDFEETLCLDRDILATVKHEQFKKKSGETATVARMKEILPAGPRPAAAATASPASLRSIAHPANPVPGEDIPF